jgi:small subunit ribosomal protein S2
MNRITLRELFQAGVHFGHKTCNWNPKMAPYLYGARQKIHIIDLDKTLPMMIEAVQVLRGIAEKRGKILFVGTKYAARDIIKEQAEACGMPYVAHRWLGGMLTNYSTIRKSIKRLKNLELMEEKGFESGMTKKEKLSLMREKDKLSQNLGGIKNMNGIPDAIFVIDVRQENIAIAEADRLGIPVIAIVDSNCNPNVVRYPIPGNDDAQRAIRLYCKTIADVVLSEQEKQKNKDAKKMATQSASAKTEKSVPVAKKVVAKDAPKTATATKEDASSDSSKDKSEK